MTQTKPTRRQRDPFAKVFASETGILFSDSTDAILAVDTEGTIRFWSTGAEALFGYTPDEIVGQSYDVLVPRRKRYREEGARIARQLEETGAVRDLQTERVSKDGDRVPVLLTQTALKGKDGEVFGAGVFLKDITERVILEEKLRHSEKLSAIGKMASHVVHEIRNPLSSILLNVDLLEDEVGEFEKAKKLNAAESRDLLRCIREELTVLKSVTDEYLHFARLPKNQPEAIDLNRTVEELVRFLKQEFFTLNVEVHTSLDAPESDVMVDPQKIRQALLNILKNAIEAMPKGGTLSIETRPFRSRVRLEISDTGPGISEEDQEEIFSPFYSTKAGGTGLGLSYAQGVVADANGRLSVKSAEGRGTAFRIDLPVLRKKS